MDAHLFGLAAACYDSFITGARIERIIEPAPDLLMFTLYNQSRRRQLYWHYGKKSPFCFLSGERLNAPGAPDAPVMRLRKYFGQKRIISSVWQIFDRRLWLLAANNEAVWLCLDLIRGASLHFNIKPPEEGHISWPGPEQLGMELQDWRNWPVLTPALRRSLAQMEEKEGWALIADLEVGGGDIFYYTESDRIKKISAWPLPEALAQGLKPQSSSDVSGVLEKAGQELLGDLLKRQETRLLEPVKKRARQLRKILDKLDQDEQRLSRMLAREPDALLIQANLWRLPRDLKTGELTLAEGGEERRIPLDGRFDIRGNMERLFHQSHRAKRGLAMLKKRRAAIQAEQEALALGAMPQARENVGNKTVQASPAAAIQKVLPKNVRAFMSPDGHVILRGKDSKGNLAMRKFASGHDLWLHVENGPGAHVIIRRTAPGEALSEATLIMAGSLAANKSWLENAAQASVMYAEVRHVKPSRKGPPGLVTIDKIQFTRLVPIDKSLEE